MSDVGKSLFERMNEVAKHSEITAEEKDAIAKKELEAFTNGIKNGQNKKKLHQNNSLPSSPVKEDEKKELNLNKPLHTMTPDERVLYAQLHKEEIEQRHLESEPSLLKNKGYKYSAMAEAILGDIFDMPDPDEEIEAEESEDVLL